MLRTTILALLAAAAGCGSNAATDCVDADGDGVTTCDGDCDDDDPLSAPGATEICGDNVDNDCDGTADATCMGIGTFVSALTGSDTNPGTKASPVATIGAGMANAATIGGPQAVIVAEGTYNEKVTLAEGVALRGGFGCDTATCTWALDPARYISKIVNQDFEGVRAGAGVTQATVVQGFEIVGKDGTATGSGSVGVTLAGGSPTLRGNRIVGGNVTGGGFPADRSIGVLLQSTTDPGGALVEGNQLGGGTSTGLSTGVMFDSFPMRTTALATITGNFILGGPGRRSIGLISWNSVAGTLVSNNDIVAGNSTNGASHGIEVGSTMTIDGNRINVDQATVGTCTQSNSWCSGIASDSSTAVITNNIVFAPKAQRSAGVFLGEFEIPAGAVVLNGNTINGGGLGAISGGRSQSAAVVVSIGQCTSCGFNGFVGRIRNNILDGGMNTERYGVREDPAMGRTMRPELLEHNVFWFSAQTGRTDVLYRQVGANGQPTDHTTLMAIHQLQAPTASGNLNADPMLDASWHLTAGSPCIDAGTATEAPGADHEGTTRPSGGGIDIGHDEM